MPRGEKRCWTSVQPIGAQNGQNYGVCIFFRFRTIIEILVGESTVRSLFLQPIKKLVQYRNRQGSRHEEELENQGKSFYLTIEMIYSAPFSQKKVRGSNSFSLSDRRVRVVIGRVGRPSLLGYQSMAHPAAAAAVECAREAVRRTFQFFLAQIGSLLSALCQFLFSFPNFSFAGFFHASSFFSALLFFFKEKKIFSSFFSAFFLIFNCNLVAIAQNPIHRKIKDFSKFLLTAL